MADDASVLLVDAGQEAGHVNERDEREVEGVAGSDEPGGLLGGLDVEHPGEHHGLVADHSDRPAIEAGEAAHDVPGPGRVVLHELALVDDGGDDLAHVVGHVGAVGHEVVELGAQAVDGVVAGDSGWHVDVVRRQVRQQCLDVVEDLMLVLRHERGHA